MNLPTTLVFDADDTLWHNEHLYNNVQARFGKLLSTYHDLDWINKRLYATEMRNLEHFGYGIKAFALSMIETAVELTEGRISGKDIQAVVDMAKEMLAAKVEPLQHVPETLTALSPHFPLMVITKGDLLDQETKVARSGLGEYFNQIEVVSHKTPDYYARVFQKHGLDPVEVMMVGNSMKSDILPILELGGQAVFIPYVTTWVHESAEPPPADQPGFYQLEHMGELLELLDLIE
jgi:putative hydrolase of the HAD superfamily